MTRDAMREQQTDDSQSQDTTSHSTIEDGDSSLDHDVTQDLTPAQQTRAARARKARTEREARMGIGGGSRG
ncbi:hypothetical protein LTR36_003102 [Oleoguttula mirabilis]|uniref:Barley leucine zipper 1 n=1 Tax=Oleoguttula mirabilis TaxID=1507867 RepID=A0AAV9JYH3_9PEZI|nr:hypothetical protein LTR36_003102 [Oleoguttula mirabilis]